MDSDSFGPAYSGLALHPRDRQKLNSRPLSVNQISATLTLPAPLRVTRIVISPSEKASFGISTYPLALKRYFQLNAVNIHYLMFTAAINRNETAILYSESGFNPDTRYSTFSFDSLIFWPLIIADVTADFLYSWCVIFCPAINMIIQRQVKSSFFGR